MSEVRYHLHPQTGVPGKCRAKRRCPFGDLETEHYPTAEVARAAFEGQMQEKLLQTPPKRLSEEDKRLFALLRGRVESLPPGDRRNFLLALQVKLQGVTNEAERSHFFFLVEKSQEELLALKRADLAEVAEWTSDVLESQQTGAYAAKRVAWAAQNLQRYQELHAAVLKRMTDEGRLDTSYGQVRLKSAKEEVERTQEQVDKLIHLQQAAEAARDAKQQDLMAKVFVEEPGELETGDSVYDGVNEFVFVTPDGQDHTVREELLQAPYSYVGRMSIAQGEALRIAQEHGAELVKLLSTPKRGFKLPKAARDQYLWEEQGENFTYSQEALDKLFRPRDGFRLLGCGSENNVYLHEPTQMVYKVPHEDSLMFGHDSLAFTAAGKKKRLTRAVYLTEEKYAKLEEGLEAVHEEGHSEVEYLKTYFLKTQDTAGQVIPVVAQPLLEQEIHRPMNTAVIVDQGKGEDSHRSLNAYLKGKGFSDIHEDNVAYNIRTGKIVLFDCLFVPSYEREWDYKTHGL